MKHVRALLILVAASMVYSSTVQSEEKMRGLSDSYGQFKAFESIGQKDQCLIVAKNCSGDIDTVTTRAERLNRGIEKGTTVYTHEELKGLRDELNWIRRESRDASPVSM